MSIDVIAAGAVGDPKVMVTNGGPHSAHDWAVISAEAITPVDPVITLERLNAVDSLRKLLVDVLTAYHSRNQTEERVRLEAAPRAEIDAPHILIHAEHALESIVAAAHITPWAEHFKLAAVQDAIRATLHHHFTLSQNIERDWFRNRISAEVI